MAQFAQLLRALNERQRETNKKLDYIIHLIKEEGDLDIMAWADVKAGVDALKGNWARISDDLKALHDKVNELSQRETVDPADLEAVSSDLGKVVGDMEEHLHADGM